MSGDCVCNLAIPGNIFQSEPHMSSHFELLAFMNKLTRHEMFKGWHKDPLFPLPEVTATNFLEYDGVTNCITVWTDGS